MNYMRHRGSYVLMGPFGGAAMFYGSKGDLHNKDSGAYSYFLVRRAMPAMFVKQWCLGL